MLGVGAMRSAEFVWLAWFVLLVLVGIYAVTILLLVLPTRRRARPARELEGVRHGHLMVLRPSPRQEEPFTGESSSERRHREN